MLNGTSHSLKILDATGRLVIELKLEKRMNIQGLGAGIYTLQTNINSELYTGKLIVR